MTDLLWAFKMLGLNLPISNRPFAHCCQIFTERNFLVALFLLRKKQSETFFLLWALFGYKDILANLFQPVKPFLNSCLKRSTLTTLLFKHFFKCLSSVISNPWKLVVCLLTTFIIKTFLNQFVKSFYTSWLFKEVVAAWGRRDKT